MKCSADVQMNRSTCLGRFSDDVDFGLFCNNGEIGAYTMAASGQRLFKHVPAATNQLATIEVLLEMGCFYMVHAEGL
jgi:hypothetical protein